MDKRERGEYDGYDYRTYDEMTEEELIDSAKKALSSAIKISQTNKDSYWEKRIKEIRLMLYGLEEAKASGCTLKEGIMMDTDYEILYRITNTINRDDGKEFSPSERGRLDLIENLLKKAPSYSCLNPEGKLSRVYARKGFIDAKCPVVISTHIDCRQHAGGEEGIIHPFCRKKKNGMLQGTFDNAITNAAAVLDILDGMLPEGAAVAFTGDEEEDNHGAGEVMELMEDMFHHGRTVTYITLDVTFDDAFEKASFTIENDFMKDEIENAWLRDSCFATGSQWRFMPVKNGSFPDAIPSYARLKGEALEDESWKYHEAENSRAFSICLPTDDTITEWRMHTDYGIKAAGDSFGKYRNAVALIADRFTRPRDEWEFIVCD